MTDLELEVLNLAVSGTRHPAAALRDLVAAADQAIIVQPGLYWGALAEGLSGVIHEEVGDGVRFILDGVEVICDQSDGIGKSPPA